MQTQPLGMYAWFGYQLPLEKRLRLMAQAGFGPRNRAFCGQHPRSLENCNTLWSDSRNEIASAIDPYFQALDYCRKYDIPILVVHVSKGSIPPPPTQSGLHALEELVGRSRLRGRKNNIKNR